MIVRISITIVFSFFCTLGCSTLMKSDLEPLSIETNPPGAKAHIGEQSCSTPCSLDLPRVKEYALRIEKEGYEKIERKIDGRSWDAWLWGNIVFFYGAPIGLAIDFYNGKAYDFEPDLIDLTLQPQPAAPKKDPSAVKGP